MLSRAGAVALALMVTIARPAASQDTLQLARSEAAGGKPEAAIARLQERLASAPDDLDARVLLGIVFGWNQKYPESRRELMRVLEARPLHVDALGALANVELWSGNPRAAETLVRRALEADPRRPDLQLALARALHATGRSPEARRIVARILQQTPNDAGAADLQRAMGLDTPWEIETAYTYDQFNDGSVSWQEAAVGLKRETAAGPVLARVSRAERFSRSDTLFEAEMYPRLGARTYGYVNLGVPSDGVLFPDYRVAVELFQSLPGAFEVSFGYRRLGFVDAIDIYTPSISRYMGDYLLSARIFLTPDSAGTSRSVHLSARKYLSDGVSYVGARYSTGSVREEIRDLDDALVLDSNGLFAELSAAATGRLVVRVAAGVSSEERAARPSLRHYSLRAALGVRF